MHVSKKTKEQIEEVFDNALNTFSEFLQKELTPNLPKIQQRTKPPYLLHDKLLKKHIKSPVNCLVYSGVLRIKGDEIFENKKITQKELIKILNPESEVYFDLYLLNDYMQDYIRSINSQLASEISILKGKILSKMEYSEKTEIEKLIKKKLKKNTRFLDNNITIEYARNSCMTKGNKFDHKHEIGFRNIYSNRFNIIANNAIYETLSFYGLNGYEQTGNIESFYRNNNFKIDKDWWYEAEKNYQTTKLLKKIKNILRHDLDINETKISYHSSIFEKNIANLLHHILKETNAIDENNKARKGKFQPICHAFYKLSKEISFKLLKSNTTLKEYIEYLNNPKLYDAKIKSSSKLSLGQNHYEKVKELIKINTNQYT